MLPLPAHSSTWPQFPWRRSSCILTVLELQAGAASALGPRRPEQWHRGWGQRNGGKAQPPSPLWLWTSGNGIVHPNKTALQ